jgi:hypothetical protein
MEKDVIPNWWELAKSVGFAKKANQNTPVKAALKTTI